MSKHKPQPKNKKELEALRLDEIERKAHEQAYTPPTTWRTIRTFGTSQGASLEPMWEEEIEHFDGINNVPQNITVTNDKGQQLHFMYVGHHMDCEKCIIYLTYAEY